MGVDSSKTDRLVRIGLAKEGELTICSQNGVIDITRFRLVNITLSRLAFHIRESGRAATLCPFLGVGFLVLSFRSPLGSLLEGGKSSVCLGYRSRTTWWKASKHMYLSRLGCVGCGEDDWLKAITV